LEIGKDRMTYRFVRHHKVLDYARVGWDIADTLQGTHHGRWSILMVWRCQCPEITPI
jgi:hypothetical protein